MKKIFLTLLCVLLAFSFIACENKVQNPVAPDKPIKPNTPTEHNGYTVTYHTDLEKNPLGRCRLMFKIKGPNESAILLDTCLGELYYFRDGADYDKDKLNYNADTVMSWDKDYPTKNLWDCVTDEEKRTKDYYETIDMQGGNHIKCQYSIPLSDGTKNYYGCIISSERFTGPFGTKFPDIANGYFEGAARVEKIDDTHYVCKPCDTYDAKPNQFLLENKLILIETDEGGVIYTDFITAE